MPQLNIIIAGENTEIFDIKKSKYVSKIYYAPKDIKFNTFRELAQKCKALHNDIVIVTNEKWILQGIGDVLKKCNVNCIAPASQWTRLGIKRTEARELLEKYDFSLPRKIILPDSFPIAVRGDGIFRIANSLDEITKIREEIYNQTSEVAQSIFLEEYVNKTCRITSLFDSKNLLTFPHSEISKELLDNYNTKLEFILNNEKADFIGFINSTVAIKNHELVNIDFDFKFPKINNDVDIVYIIISAIYQKLNEIKFT